MFVKTFLTFFNVEKSEQTYSLHQTDTIDESSVSKSHRSFERHAERERQREYRCVLNQLMPR